MSQRLACQVTGQARSTQQRTPKCERPDDPDRWLRDWLNEWATNTGNARKGYRRAWADLRYEEGLVINKKKVHRIWREEKLQVAKRRRRQRVGESSGPIIDADAANIVWASISNIIRPPMAESSRSRQWSTSTPENRCLTSPNVRSPVPRTALVSIIAVRGLPVLIRCDNGPDSTHAL